jgi:predicted transcriptional regulator
MATLQKITPANSIEPINMAISNELSSDVAAALLAKNKSPQELEQLKDVILQVHSTLQKMSEETRSDRLSRTSHKKAQKAQNEG